MKKQRLLPLLVVCVLALGAVVFAACGDDKKANTYTVRFEGAAVASQTVEDGKTATKPNDPERIGWTFDGWYDGDEAYDFSAAVKRDLTLTARFSSVLGGTGTDADPFTIDSAAELALLKSYIDAGADEFKTAHYVQTAAIEATLAAPIPTFAGVYDGGNKTLSLAAPLFGTLTGTVKDLTVTAAITADGGASGAIANTAENATVSRVTVHGSVTETSAAGSAGGLVGIVRGGS